MHQDGDLRGSGGHDTTILAENRAVPGPLFSVAPLTVWCWTSVDAAEGSWFILTLAVMTVLHVLARSLPSCEVVTAIEQQ